MAILEQTNNLKEKKSLISWFKKKKEIKIADYIQTNQIFFLQDSSCKEAINSLVEGLYSFKVITDKKFFLKGIVERENLVSTGIGLGVAIPHAKLSCLNDFFIAIGIQKEKGIEWNSIDKAPVRLVFMIGGPENKQYEYLQILSHLTKIIKDETLRKKIISAKNREEVIKLFASF